MKTVTKRELNQHTAQVLALVDAGESVIVTERGIERWRIEPATDQSPIERLTMAGRIRPAKANPRPWPKSSSRTYTTAEIDALFADSRGDH